MKQRYNLCIHHREHTILSKHKKGSLNSILCVWQKKIHVQCIITWINQSSHILAMHLETFTSIIWIFCLLIGDTWLYDHAMNVIHTDSYSTTITDIKRNRDNHSHRHYYLIQCVNAPEMNSDHVGEYGFVNVNQLQRQSNNNNIMTTTKRKKHTQ